MADEQMMTKVVNFLINLSEENISDDTEMIKKYDELKKIYINSGQYARHLYSDLFPMLTEIFGDGQGGMDALSNNIGKIYDMAMDNYYKCEDDTEAKANLTIRKLYDHINLEIARLNYAMRLHQKQSEENINSLGEVTAEVQTAITALEDIENIRKKVESVRTDAEEVYKRIGNIYTEFISILGIFTAIVLVFLGGISIVQNVSLATTENSILSIGLVILFIGLVVCNIIFMFFDFLSKFVGRDIYDSNIYQHYVGAQKFKHRYPIVYWANFYGFAMIIIGIVFSMYEKTLEVTRGIIDNAMVIKSDYHYAIIAIIVLIDALFILMYILAKIFDVNIGKKVKRYHSARYDIVPLGADWLFRKNTYGSTLWIIMEKYGDDERYKNIGFKKKMVKKIKLRLMNFFAPITPIILNYLSKLFVRYWYLWPVNAIPILSLYIIYLE